MAKKPRENRIPIMMSDDELALIDNWRFDNRIATRSDAIRRLCRMALILDSKLTPIFNAVNEFSKSYIDSLNALAEASDKDVDEFTVNKAGLSVAKSNLDFVILKTTIRELTGQAYNFKSDEKDLYESLLESSELSEFFDGILDRAITASKEGDTTNEDIKESNDD